MTQHLPLTVPSLLLAALCATVACVEPGPGPEEEARTASATHLLFDPDLGDGFWSFPFPSDLRTTVGQDGRSNPDMAGFPNPEDTETLADFLAFASTKQGGAGLSSPAWFRFDGPLADLGWDEAAVRASAACEGPLRVVDVDPDSAARGTCVPLRWRWSETAPGDPWMDDDMAMVAPFWGFPLRGGTTYAAMIVDVVDPAGDWIEGPAAMQQALAGTSSDDALQAVYRPLADMLADDPALAGDVGPRWVAAATVFTTQDVRGEMDRLAARVLSDPDLPRWNADEGLRLLTPDDPEHVQEYDLYEGSYTALNFQEGEIPYSDAGGGFVWDGDDPVPQMEERIPLAIGTPRSTFVQPESGWPVILHAHGTGGDHWSHLTGGSQPALMGAGRGFVSVGIPQPIHGERWPEGSEMAISLYSFNYFNPDSGVSMFRQGALDTVALARFVRESMAEGGPIAEQYPQLRIDPDQVYFLGHSQGGITGAIAVPFAEGVGGWVLSGAGGGLSMTIMQREDPVVMRDMLLAAVGAPEGMEVWDEHPLIGVIQAAAERTDPLNYAPLWDAESTGSPVSVLLTEGLLDEQTPADTSEALATAGRLPIAIPFFERDVLGLELRDLPPLDTPYSGNVEHSSGTQVTTALAQFDSDHFAIFYEADAALLWANFLYSMVRDGPPGEMGAEFP